MQRNRRTQGGKNIREAYEQGRRVGERGGRNIRECGSNSNQNMLNTYKKLSRNKFY